MDSLISASKTLENAVTPVLKNPYLMAVLKISLALYAAQVAPKLPNFGQKLLQNTFVKIFLLTLMVYLAEKDFQLAVIIAIVFVIGMNVASGRGFLESYANYNSQWKPEGKLKLLEPNTDIAPGCVNIKLQDLLDLFQGDHLKLQNTVQYTYWELLQALEGTDSHDHLQRIARALGLPHNIELNDENAPFVATMFMYAGFNVKDACKPPE